MDLNGILLVCESGNRRIVYIDHKKVLKIDVAKSTKQTLCELAAMLIINEPGKIKLKTLIENNHSKIELERLPKNPTNLIRPFDIGVDNFQPTKVVKVNEDLLFVADLNTKSILQVTVGRKMDNHGYELYGNSLCLIDIPDMSGCFGLTYRMNCLYVADHVAGILRIDLNAKVSTVILKSNTEHCSQPHGIAIVGNDLIFSDVTLRKNFRIKEYEEAKFENQVDIAVFAGTGAEGNEDGLSHECQFSQPSGVCSEGNTLFVVDSGSKNVRIITLLSALNKYLTQLNKLYTSFSVHCEILGSGHSDDIKRSITELKDIEMF
ncbi:unnamed protein product [Mytilus coruscus]|uniref:Uncharacterized protein n=1 Tax=Mytilus coruscus TaxID=42192 RepID=A0A6J8D262_MYTCO|nr:unnamed protein product [Mytilus coruscus]